MNLTLLQELVCPHCPDEMSLYISSGSEVRGTDLFCGFLECEFGCLYPVIDGVAVVTPSWEDEISKHRGYIERTIPDAAVPECLRQGFEFTYDGKHHVDEEVVPYVFNHLCFSGIAVDKNPADEVVSPMLRALIVESATVGPYQLVRRHTENQRGARHLDIGCSVGTAIAISAEQGTDISLGIDISFPAVHTGRSMIPALSENENGIAELIVAAAEHLPVRSAAWSLVSALNVVDEVSAPNAVTNELSRTVAPSGHLLIVAPFRERDNLICEESGLVAVQGILDIPWVILRGPRYLEFLSVDAYLYQRPAQAGAERT